MRLSNKKNIPIYQFIFTFINVWLLIGIFAYILKFNDINIFKPLIDRLLLFPPIVLHLIFYLRGKQVFEYDSDGETLNFYNRSIVPILFKDAKDEFPKYKLLSYEIVNTILFKKLYIKISSKKSNKTILKYDISYLGKKEIRDLKISLNKVIKQNKETASIKEQRTL
ncbi:hypothetical protein [Riemerella columbina]|uniref:hypothetical protein n=1 Tax=Riemerella columbina TaxID=103810 RepID=UPI0003673FCA|nr:hypothetical protein [Riemerella columbina]